MKGEFCWGLGFGVWGLGFGVWADEQDYSCKILCRQPVDDVGLRYKAIFDAMSLWGNFEYEFSGTEILIRQR